MSSTPPSACDFTTPNYAQGCWGRVELGWNRIGMGDGEAVFRRKVELSARLEF